MGKALARLSCWNDRRGKIFGLRSGDAIFLVSFIGYVVGDVVTTKAVRRDCIFARLRSDRRIGPNGWRAKIRQDGLLLDLTFAESCQVVGYGFFLVESDLAGVGANETFVEDAARELVELFIF